MGKGTEHAIWLRETLKAERTRRGWSLEDLAVAVAVELGRDRIPKQSVHDWETFRVQPRMNQFAAWARALGMRLETDLVRDDDERAVVMLPRDVARIARVIALMPKEDRDAVGQIVDRMGPVQKNPSADS